MEHVAAKGLLEQSQISVFLMQLNRISKHFVRLAIIVHLLPPEHDLSLYEGRLRPTHSVIVSFGVELKLRCDYELIRLQTEREW